MAEQQPPPSTTTTSGLFGDDDDDDDDDSSSSSSSSSSSDNNSDLDKDNDNNNNNVENSVANNNNTTDGDTTTAATTDEKSSNNEKAEEKKTTLEEEQKVLKDSDASEEEEDAEFEDDGITGGAASDQQKQQLLKKKKDIQNTHVMNRIREEDSDDDDGDENNPLFGGGGEKIDVDETSAKVEGLKQKRRRLPPRNLEVLDLPRPNNVSSSSSSSKDKVTLHMTKLPNLLGINPDAFHPKTYDADLEEREYRGYVHNMIRWRYKLDEDGDYERDSQRKLIRESNARFVKWSDGSYTIHCGDEVFEVDNIDSSNPKTGWSGLNGYLYLSQKAKSSEETSEKGGGGTVLECIAPISSKMTARPSSLQSEAHKKLTLAVRQKNMKKARIAEYVTQVDPEKEKSIRIKNKEDLNRQTERGMKRGGGGSRRYRSPAMSRRYLEEDDGHYDSVSIGAMKRRTMDGMEEEVDRYGSSMRRGGGGRYDSDDGVDDDDDWARRGKFQKGGRNRGSKPAASSSRRRDDESEEEEEEEEMFGEESSDEEDVSRIKAVGKKRGRENVFGEDDDDDDDDD